MEWLMLLTINKRHEAPHYGVFASLVLHISSEAKYNPSTLNRLRAFHLNDDSKLTKQKQSYRFVQCSPRFLDTFIHSSVCLTTGP
jgi:hypothetical protein